MQFRRAVVAAALLGHFALLGIQGTPSLLGTFQTKALDTCGKHDPLTADPTEPAAEPGPLYASDQCGDLRLQSSDYQDQDDAGYPIQPKHTPHAVVLADYQLPHTADLLIRLQRLSKPPPSEPWMTGTPGGLTRPFT